MAGDGEFRRLGPYVLLRASGAGGMGRIDLALRAQAGGIPELCVLKRMHAELDSREHEARFRREASIALQLTHAGIARTVRVEEIDGQLVMLQELVHGVDVRLLSTRLAAAGERVPWAVAVHIASEVARALAYAHAFGDRGIVHRDVTPDNIMLSFAGEVKLIDFGIARSDVDATLTSAGQIVGRPTYTAPEIWAGAQADRRADIYSLGVVLWQLLTGRRLEEARAGGAAPPPSAHNADMRPELDAVVARALARVPDQRYQHASELHEALRWLCPSGVVPRQALADLLARHFDVARERRMLAVEVERATRCLRAVARAEPPATDKRSGRRRHTAVARKSPKRSQRPVLVTAFVAAGVVIAVGLGLRSAWHGVRRVGVATAPPATGGVRPSPPLALPASPTPAVPIIRPAVALAEEAGTEAVAKTTSRAHPIALSAGRARPPGAKPTRPAPGPSADELLRRAQDKFDVGETAAALALAQQAANAGTRAPAHVLMGKVMMSERRVDEAEREFAEAVRLDPGDAAAARLLSLVRETRSGTP